MNAIAESEWQPQRRRLLTRLAGQISSEDVQRWHTSLNRELSRIEPGTRFTVLVDVRSAAFTSPAVKRRMRPILPRTLAQYGFRTMHTDLPVEINLRVCRTREIECCAAAHVCGGEWGSGLAPNGLDPAIGEHPELFARENERSFRDPREAEAWLDALRA